MKKILILIYACIGVISIALADTMNVTWYNIDSTVYDTTTCTVGGTLNLPTAPTRYGYTFKGWIPYTSIEYIESTGSQWIDTGVYLTDNSKIEITCNIPSANGNHALYGAGNGSTATQGEIALFWRTGVYDAVYPTGQNSSAYTSFGPVVTDAKHVITFSKYGCFVNDVSKINRTFYNGYVGTRSLTLFAVHRDSVGYFAAFKLYSAKIWDEDTLVRDFIPVLDSNGVACMYDKISNTFFYNNGTGDFIAGPAL
jgi:hypothetical protein